MLVPHTDFADGPQPMEGTAAAASSSYSLFSSFFGSLGNERKWNLKKERKSKFWGRHGFDLRNNCLQGSGFSCLDGGRTERRKRKSKSGFWDLGLCFGTLVFHHTQYHSAKCKVVVLGSVEWRYSLLNIKYEISFVFLRFLASKQGTFISFWGWAIDFFFLIDLILNLVFSFSYLILLSVAQPDTASAVDAQTVEDPPSARFTWTIENFTRLNTKKLYSDVFYVGGYKW